MHGSNNLVRSYNRSHHAVLAKGVGTEGLRPRGVPDRWSSSTAGSQNRPPARYLDFPARRGVAGAFRVRALVKIDQRLAVLRRPFVER